MPRPPEYQRVEADIRRRIATGEWRPGDRLPTMEQLAAEYGVSLQPIKTAVMRLEIAGVLEGQQGKGVYVA